MNGWLEKCNTPVHKQMLIGMNSKAHSRCAQMALSQRTCLDGGWLQAGQKNIYKDCGAYCITTSSQTSQVVTVTYTVQLVASQSNTDHSYPHFYQVSEPATKRGVFDSFDTLILYLEDDCFRPWPNLPTGPR